MRNLDREEKIERLKSWFSSFSFINLENPIFKEFSDGFKVAEIMKAYRPDIVKMHFYIASSNPVQKRVNWENLKSRKCLIPEKVFEKIDFRPSNDFVDRLIERFDVTLLEDLLFKLMKKLDPQAAGGQSKHRKGEGQGGASEVSTSLPSRVSKEKRDNNTGKFNKEVNQKMSMERRRVGQGNENKEEKVRSQGPGYERWLPPIVSSSGGRQQLQEKMKGAQDGVEKKKVRCLGSSHESSPLFKMRYNQVDALGDSSVSRPRTTPLLRSVQVYSDMLRKERNITKNNEALPVLNPNMKKHELIRIIQEKNKVISGLITTREACLDQIRILEEMVDVKNKKIYMLKHKNDTNYLKIL